jgi:hypothetical protein
VSTVSTWARKPKTLRASPFFSAPLREPIWPIRLRQAQVRSKPRSP